LFSFLNVFSFHSFCKKKRHRYGVFSHFFFSKNETGRFRYAELRQNGRALPTRRSDKQISETKILTLSIEKRKLE